ncbi:MAG: hypothetical protein WAM72_10820 [Xanthobacteraceae bacterium]
MSDHAFDFLQSWVVENVKAMSCLISNRSRISEACRMALAHYNRPMTSRAKLITVP